MPRTRGHYDPQQKPKWRSKSLVKPSPRSTSLHRGRSPTSAQRVHIITQMGDNEIHARVLEIVRHLVHGALRTPRDRRVGAPLRGRLRAGGGAAKSHGCKGAGVHKARWPEEVCRRARGQGALCVRQICTDMATALSSPPNATDAHKRLHMKSRTHAIPTTHCTHVVSQNMMKETL